MSAEPTDLARLADWREIGRAAVLRIGSARAPGAMIRYDVSANED
jgi:hypothetical protein